MGFMVIFGDLEGISNVALLLSLIVPNGVTFAPNHVETTTVHTRLGTSICATS